MPKTGLSFPEDRDALRALMALHVEVPEAIAKDVHAKVNASIDARDAYILQLRAALDKIVTITDRKHEAWDEARALLSR